MRIKFIYRSYEGEMDPSTIRRGPEGRPDYFDKRKCYKSFYDAYQNLKKKYPNEDISLTILHNRDLGKLSEYIKDVSENIEFINFEADPNQTVDESKYPDFRIKQHMTTKTVWSILKEMDADFFYISEDDYLYTPDAFLCLYEVFSMRGDKSLVTLFDHKDRYTRTDDITLHKESIYVTESCHWRTHESTCHSYGISKELFDRYYHLINPKNGYCHDREMYRTLYYKGERLWGPIPGKATHMQPAFYSPCVDWKFVSDSIKL